MASISTYVFVLPLLLSITLQPLAATAATAQAHGHGQAHTHAPAPSPTHTHASPADIKKVCDGAVNPQLCMTSLKSDPESHNADILGLATIAIKYAMNNATAIHDHIEQLQNKTKDPFYQQCLTDCLENYADAVDQLDDSLAALESKGYNDASSWVKAAITDAEACDEGFSEQAGKTPLLSDFNGGFALLCGNALTIIDLLAGGRH